MIILIETMMQRKLLMKINSTKKDIVDIIIPTSGRPDIVLECVRSINHSQQAANTNYPVFVVEDGCKYKEETIRNIISFPNHRFYRLMRGGPAKARNFAVKHSSSEYILFIDDDCVVPDNYIHHLQVILESLPSHIVAFGGGIKPFDSLNRTRCGCYLRMNRHLDGPLTANGQIVNMATANLCVLRRAFTQVGGFDTTHFSSSVGGEDQHLVSRLSTLGQLMFFDHFALFHRHDISFLQFCGKFLKYGRGVAINNLLLSKHLHLDCEYQPADPKSTCGFLLHFIRIPFAKARHSSLLSFPLFFLLSFIQELMFQLGYYMQLKATTTKEGSSE